MDLIDFEMGDLYFDEPAPEEVHVLVREAAAAYGEGGAEALLLRAYFLAPGDLGVLVALYRFYYYQHRLADALVAAMRALEASGGRVGLSADWRQVNEAELASAVKRSIALVRFYLLALKGAGCMMLRQGNLEEGAAMLGKVAELDPLDRLGATALLDVVSGAAKE